MFECTREPAIDIEAVDAANEAADRVRAEVLARSGLDFSVCRLCISYDPESTEPFRFRNDRGANVDTWNPGHWSLVYSNGTPVHVLWDRRTRIYHATGRPLGHLSVYVDDRLIEMRDVKAMRAFHGLKMDGGPIFYA